MDADESVRRLLAAHPLAVREKMNAQNGAFDLAAEQSVLLGNIKVGSFDFLDLYRQCKDASATGDESSEKFLSRPLRALSLARYFEATLQSGVGGGYAECGVFRGFTALLLSRVARDRDPRFDGSRLWLVDSFEGLAPMTEADHFVWRSKEGKAFVAASNDRFEETSPDFVARVMAQGGAPKTTIRKGWIPEVFGTLPDQAWAFVHVDVDQYAPTKACLEYFWERMAPGGTLLCDDYVTPYFPGAMKAWDEFCQARNLRFLILDTGQSVLRKAE